MNTTLLQPVIDGEMRPFESACSALVAGWAPTPAELFMLAPGTPPPLTPDKVIGWSGATEHPLLLWERGADQPSAYGELNFMPHNRQELWIGHIIVPLAQRGRGLGFAMVTRLLQMGFSVYDARQISLVVFPENEPAVNCYLKAGMVEDGLQLRNFDHCHGDFHMLRMVMSRRRYHRQVKHWSL
ncbi:MAG: hypothetical protein HJJLKODD_02049 [Phycisphaerae bacterium]|nr:hypothetical protein [Phycisphaerae bacterium]